MPVQLERPVGLPTGSSAAEDSAWSTLLSTQLEDVRKTAENWRNGLVAIVTALAAFSVIKGPTDISGLNRFAAYAVGLLLLLALVCGLFGAWSTLTAAFGTPGALTRDEFHQQGGIDGYRLRLAAHAAEKLRCAQVATIVTLTLLIVAVGLTWYGPRSNSVTLKIERKSLPNICGKLLSSSNGQIEIKPPASETVRLLLADVVKVTAAKKCDE